MLRGSQSKTDIAKVSWSLWAQTSTRRYAYASGHYVARWLVRVAPKLCSFANAVFAKELACAGCDEAMEIVVPAITGDVRFTILPPPARSQSEVLWFWQEERRFFKSGMVYEPMMLACLTRLLHRGAMPRFMDIGAFFGYYACYVSALLGDQHEIVAIESNPLYTQAIRELAHVNGFSQLRVFQAALSDRVEPVSIKGVTVQNDTNARDESVTLDDLCARERLRPTVIKMDVHGAEGKIVHGMRDTLAHVECMLLEMHNLPLMQEYSPGVTRTAMLDTLEDAGLTLYYVAGHHAFNKFASKSDFRKMLAGGAYSYRRLDCQARDLLLFDRREDEFVLALRHDDVESLLGPNVSRANE